MRIAQISDLPAGSTERDPAPLLSGGSLEHGGGPTLFEVKNLRVEIGCTEAKSTCILDGISLDIRRDQAIGILGESGCGKTTLARSLLRLLPENFQFAGGSIHCQGTDILRMSSKDLTRMRGAVVSLVHQEPAGALHPTMRIGSQVAEILRAHNRWSRKKCLDDARTVLAEVFPAEIDRIFNSYPHELSGGQRQRVLIAQAISCRPSLIIADEPTASLDLTTQAEIILLLKSLRKKYGMAIILITHNPALLCGLVDRVLVMYGGQVVEEGASEAVFASPMHPYTKDLLRLRPGYIQIKPPGSGSKLPVIEGSCTARDHASQGCHYESRCGQRVSKCAAVMPEERQVEESRRVRCFLYEN